MRTHWLQAAYNSEQDGVSWTTLTSGRANTELSHVAAPTLNPKVQQSNAGSCKPYGQVTDENCLEPTENLDADR